MGVIYAEYIIGSILLDLLDVSKKEGRSLQ